MPTQHFAVGTLCNNGCRGCLWTRGIDLLTAVSLPPPETVRGARVRLAGREPTMLANLDEIVGALKTAGAASIEIETNGRMLSSPAYVKKLLDAGVTQLVIKLFGSDEATWDAHTRVAGSYRQTLRGISIVQRLAPRTDLVALIVPRRGPHAGLPELVDFAHELGFKRARVQLRIAKLDLAALEPLAAQVQALHEHPPNGMRIDVSRL